MEVKPAIGNVVGKATDTHWSQTLSLPNFYAVIEVVAGDAIARLIGMKVLNELNASLSQNPSDLNEIRSIVDNCYKPEIVSLILFAPIGMTCYIIQKGEGCSYLKRNDRFTVLLDDEGFVSGTLVHEDTLLIATKSVIQSLDDMDIAGVFDHLPAQLAAEKMMLLLNQKSEDVSGSALIYQLPKETIKYPEEEVIDDSVIMDRRMAGLNVSGVTDSITAKIKSFSFINKLKISAVRRKIRVVFSGKKSFYLVIILVILSVLFIAVRIGLGRKAKVEITNEASRLMESARHDYEEGVALYDLNPLKSRERLKAAEDALSKIDSDIAADSSVRREFDQLFENVKKQLTVAMQSYDAQAQVYYDTGLLKSQAVASVISLNKDNLGILDSSGKTVFTLSLADKSAKIIGGGELISSSRVIGSGPDSVFALTSDGIYEFTLKASKNPDNPAVTKDDKWGNIGSIVSFAGNLYLLDTQNSRIWKYVATEDGFTTVREYLNADVMFDLSKATGMAIDGSVWVGSSEGKIYKFTSGTNQSFSVQGVEEGLGNSLYIYTDDECQYLYILDRDNKRVVVTDKEGLYISQYQLDSKFSPSHMVASEKNRQVFFLSDGLIYSFSLK